MIYPWDCVGVGLPRGWFCGSDYLPLRLILAAHPSSDRSDKRAAPRIRRQLRLSRTGGQSIPVGFFLGSNAVLPG